MSIYVYVTRKQDPFDTEGPAITEDEWDSLIDSDPDLTRGEPDDGYPGIHAVWRSYPRGYPAWFVLSDGNIEVKGIDDALLGKLRRFAAELTDARIVSEEGEEFS